MHPNPAFRAEARARHIAFARMRAFGVLSVNADQGPLISHIPFLLNEDAASAEFHLVRSNPIARIGTANAVIAVSGPDGYISPDWYGIEDQVPTWNYVAVHLRGRIEPLPPETIRDLLDRQSADAEARLAPKAPWKTDKMSLDALDRMLRMILPFRLHIEQIDGTWKLNQNKSDTARLGAAEGLLTSDFGQEIDALSQLMRDVPDAS